MKFFKNITEPQKGNIFVLAEMVLWSLFPIVSVLGFKGLSPLVSLFWVDVFGSILFLALMIYKNRWKELCDMRVWKYSLGVVIFICVLFYGFYYYGLTYTVPSNAAIVALFEIVPSYIFFQIIRKEAFLPRHFVGIVLAVIGALIVLLPKAHGINIGDWIILGATFFAPFGNWFQKKARDVASTETVLFLRHILTLPFLLLIIYFLKIPFTTHISHVVGWLLLNGIVIFGISKILWVEAIHRMSVTRALAISNLNPVFTVLFAWLLLRQAPTAVQLVSLPFLIVSVMLLTNIEFRKPKAVLT